MNDELIADRLGALTPKQRAWLEDISDGTGLSVYQIVAEDAMGIWEEGLMPTDEEIDTLY